MELCLGIEDDYQGPRFEDGGVTLKFVTDLMKTFKEQKKLHRKYAYQVRIKYIPLLYLHGKPVYCLFITFN